MKEWNFLINTFLIITVKSYRTAKKLGDYTLSALLSKDSDPAISLLAFNLEPFVTNFNTAYTNWLSKIGTQKSHTNELSNNLKLLSSTKIKQWDIAVQGQYIEGTSQYIAIFPNHRRPFQQGSQEDRMAACEALSLALTGIVPLASTKADVDAFIDTLKANFVTQKGSLSNTGSNSDALDAARQAMCIEMYGVLGQLMSIYKADPSDVRPFFDLETIRNHEQTLFRGTLNANEIELVLTHTFIEGEQVKLANKGTTTLRFALVPLSTSDIAGTTFVDLEPNSETVVLASELGNLANRFLKVLNTGNANNNKYSVMLL